MEIEAERERGKGGRQPLVRHFFLSILHHNDIPVLLLPRPLSLGAPSQSSGPYTRALSPAAIPPASAAAAAATCRRPWAGRNLLHFTVRRVHFKGGALIENDCEKRVCVCLCHPYEPEVGCFKCSKNNTNKSWAFAG